MSQIKFSTDDSLIFEAAGRDIVTMNASGLLCTGDITAFFNLDKRLKENIEKNTKSIRKSKSIKWIYI